MAPPARASSPRITRRGGDLALAVLVALALGVSSCAQGSAPAGTIEAGPSPSLASSPSPAPTRSPASPTSTAAASTIGRPDFRIVGYVGDLDGAITAEQLAMVTHVNYAFITPKEDGTFSDIANSWKLHDLVEAGDEIGVQVLISVGGWGWDEEFEALAAGDETRTAFVAGLAAFAEEYSLDGIDIDWEYPDPGASSDAYLALMQELRDVLPAGEKLLTTAVVAAGDTGAGVPAEVFDLVDFVNVMAYDGADHSSYAYAEEGLAYWSERGLPLDKTVLGVPFYSRPSYVPYRDLVDADPAAAHADELERYGVVERYNGMPTVARKTRLAMERASGVMIWTLSQDTTDATSLLATIHSTARAGAGSP